MQYKDISCNNSQQTKGAPDLGMNPILSNSHGGKKNLKVKSARKLKSKAMKNI